MRVAMTCIALGRLRYSLHSPQAPKYETSFIESEGVVPLAQKVGLRAGEDDEVLHMSRMIRKFV
jgi:hypothetical protein